MLIYSNYVINLISHWQTYRAKYPVALFNFELLIFAAISAECHNTSLWVLWRIRGN